MKNMDTVGQKGDDAGKKMSGIKRHIVVDTQGLLHAVERCKPDWKQVQSLLRDSDYRENHLPRARATS